MVNYVIRCRNMFPDSDGVSDSLSPLAIITGAAPNSTACLLTLSSSLSFFHKVGKFCVGRYRPFFGSNRSPESFHLRGSSWGWIELGLGSSYPKTPDDQPSSQNSCNCKSARRSWCKTDELTSSWHQDLQLQNVLLHIICSEYTAYCMLLQVWVLLIGLLIYFRNFLILT
jgi:hypothetical protein